ncbi:MAG: hypothetical protein ACJAT2_001508 [Bacteriovoracaceae bacterium]|jgi:hypothetical protein
MTKIYGFSFLKDGVRYDYPFKEAFKSLSSIASKTYVALGQNDDGTFEELKKLPELEIIHTVWDMNLLGKGGVIFSEQANIALNKIREVHGKEPSAWAVYLQSDEIIHEDAIDQLKRDIEKADVEGCDAIRLRYFHFWKSHYEVAINKRWYPTEIRVVKLDSKVINHGDAQGFSGFTKVYDSDVYIHHYGHVRDEEKRQEKQKFLIKSIRQSEKFQKYFKREQKAFADTKTLAVLLKHPLVMKERIEKMGESFNLPQKDIVYIVGNAEEYPSSTQEKINAKVVRWCSSLREVPKAFRSSAVILKPSFLERILYPTKIPKGMLSELARPWDRDSFLLLKLSEKGVSFK